MGNLTEIKVGTIVKVNGAPFLVTKNQFMRKDAGKPVMRTKLKNLMNGNSLDKTFLAGESFEFADVEKRRCQFLYKDGEDAHFMDGESFEQFTLNVTDIEDALKYLKDDIEVFVTFYEGGPIGVQAPVKMALTVTETTPGVKGDTATGGSKQATVESGAVVIVPLFIKEGESIIINTETGEYVSREN